MNRPLRIASATMLLAAVFLIDVPPALAVVNTIHVETAADNTTTDAVCSLREAISNANDDAATYPDCAAGTADDEIVFDGNYTITLGSELPWVSTMLTITGNGAQVSIIEAGDCNPVTLPGGCTPSSTGRVLGVESSGDLTLYGVTIRHGDVSPLVEPGGGILNAGSLSLENSTVMGNKAGSGGGLYSSGVLTIERSTFSGNSTTAGSGGGLFIGPAVGASSAVITNSTFTANDALYAGAGGAISDDGQALTIINSTIAGNTGGHALYVYDASGNGPMAVYNSIISDNVDGNCLQDGGVTFTVDAYSQASSSCQNATVRTVAQIGLHPLEANDGPTPTMALVTGSSAIDTGDNAACAAAPVSNLDQRGKSRPVDGNFDATATCDIGAYEYQGHLFDDVPVTGKEWMEPWIVAFYNAGITTGCGSGPLIYCPENNVTRAEMAVFLLRAIHGSGYAPPAPAHDFGDVPVTGKEWMEPWIEQFYAEGITTGCGGGNYCPENNVTRAEMAVFVLRALNGGGYSPPSATHTFADVPVPGKEWMEPWIDQFAAEGITTGCGGGNYCPENNVTRAEMAVFIDRAYGLYP